MAKKSKTKVMRRPKKHLHEKLGITFPQLGVLLGTRELLKMGALTYSTADRRHAENGEHLFNMNIALRNNSECGSVGCIGGTMAMLMGMNSLNGIKFVHSHDIPGDRLKELFFPKGVHDYSCITPALAVKAINNFLKTGNPSWRKVLPKQMYLYM